jgi:hypothetical protein
VPLKKHVVGACFVASWQLLYSYSSLHHTIVSPCQMSSEVPPQNKKRPQSNCKYSAKEQQVIEVHKVAYRTAATKEERVLILRRDILPAIFAYWATENQEPQSEDESRVCSKVNFAMPIRDGVDYLSRRS